MKKIVVHLLSICLMMTVISSCISHKDYSFGKLNSIADLNGVYPNTDKQITKAFNISDDEKMQVMKLDFDANQNLHLLYWDGSKYELVDTYKAVIKNGKEYAEITLKRKKQFYLLYAQKETDEVRIGKDAYGKLCVDKFRNKIKHITLYTDIEVHEDVHAFNKMETSTPLPLNKGEKWGYADTNGKEVIPARFDYVDAFENGVARAKSRNAWGLIDTKGNMVTPFKYDSIAPFNFDAAAKIYSNHLVGLVDTKGVEIAPIEYDEIGHFLKNDTLAITRKNDKYGIASCYRIVYPPVFDNVELRKIDSKEAVQALNQLITFIGFADIGTHRYVADSKGDLYEWEYNLWTKLVISQYVKKNYQLWLDGHNKQKKPSK